MKPATDPFNALPPYFGGKRRLIPWIFKHLSEIHPPAQWADLTFLDPFAGGGSISLFAKAQGFKTVQTNDWSGRSQIVAQALLINQQQTLSQEDLLYLTQPLPGSAPGRIEAEFVPHVFSSRHAQALDRIAYWANQYEDATHKNLGLLLLWHLVQDYVCMPTSLNTSNRPYAETLDGLRDWQELNPQRFVDGSFPRLLQPKWAKLESIRTRINAGILGGSPVIAHQLEACAFLGQTAGEIVYLDPPYAGSLSYESSLKTLDAVLLGKTPEPLPSISPFSQELLAFQPLLDSINHIPTWILSYSNHLIELPELVALIQAQAADRVVIGAERNYQHLAHVSKTDNRKELLILAYYPEAV